MEAKLKKSSPAKTAIHDTMNEASGLLRHTKATAAALAQLEKSIGLIFKKEFKKALQELNSLCKSFPEETEILARARSYVTICQREEKTPSRHEPTADQLYAMGVMEHNKAHYDEAISYYRQSMKSHPGGDYIYYSIAASFAKKGDFAESMGNLKKAIELNEDSRIYARNDDDFAAFLTREEFAELVGITQNPADESQ